MSDFDALPERQEKEPAYYRCDYCRDALRWFGKSEQHGGQNRIVGRSKRGGYACRDCYEKRPDEEFDWLDARIDRLSHDHRDDKIGVMLNAAKGKQTREQRRELIGWMKDCVRNFGSVPYDKQEREAG